MSGAESFRRKLFLRYFTNSAHPIGKLYSFMVIKNQSTNKTLLLIFLLALTVRILFNIFYVGTTDVPISDAQDYHKIALSLLHTGAYHSTFRPPLLPFFIAILYKLFGVNYFVVRIVLSIFSSFTCLIVYKISKEIFDRQVALIAAFISSIYWMMFYWCGFLLTETLCTFFLMLAVLYLIKSVRAPRMRYFIFGGMCLGLAALARAFVFPIFLFLPLWAYTSFKSNTRFVYKSCVIISLAMFLVILPCTMRNYMLTNKFVPIASQGGFNLLGANNPEILKYYKGGVIHPIKSGLFKKGELNLKEISSAEADQLYWKKGLDFIGKNPFFVIKLMFYKFKLFWHLHRDISLPSLQYFFVLLFAIYGSFISLKKFTTISILYLLPLFFTCMSLIFWGDDRIRSPIEPIFVIFAAYGIAQILERGKTTEQ